MELLARTSVTRLLDLIFSILHVYNNDTFPNSIENVTKLVQKFVKC